MTFIQLANLFSTKEEKINLLVKIVGKVGSKQYIVADQSASGVPLEVGVHRTIHAPYLIVDKTIKILNPVLDKESAKIIIGSKTHIFFGTGLKMGEQAKRKCEICLKDVAALTPRQTTVGRLLVKIIKADDCVINTKNGVRDIKKLVVKDINGAKNKITIWKRNNNKSYWNVQEGLAYYFTNLFIDNYPENSPHFLSDKDTTKVELASKEVQDQFVRITLADDAFNGTILGFQEIVVYKACTKCRTAVKTGDEAEERCKRCFTKVENPTDCFRYHIVIELEEKEKDDLSLVGFSTIFSDETMTKLSSIDFSDKNAPDAIELKLNEIYGSTLAAIEITTNFGDQKEKILYSLSSYNNSYCSNYEKTLVQCKICQEDYPESNIESHMVEAHSNNSNNGRGRRTRSSRGSPGYP